MLIKILCVIFCFLGLSLNIQFAGLLLGYSPRCPKALNIFLALICAAPTFVLVDKSVSFTMPAPLRLLLFAVFLAGRLCTYFITYRKADLKIFYFFLLTVNVPQLYYNILSPFIGDYIIGNMAAFAFDSLVSALLMFAVMKKGYLPFIKDLIKSLPARIYVVILALLYAASFSMMSEALENAKLLKIIAIPATFAVIAAVVSIVRISISETEKRSEVELLSRQVENQIEYYEKINRIYGEFRSFRHDYKNHVLSLRALISAAKYEEALEYLNVMQEMSSVEKNRYHTGNVIIDALLDDKSENAEKAGATIAFEGSVPSSGISNADLCIIIANAVDNAVEACAADESPAEKEIRLNSVVRQGYLFFSITNPVCKPVTVKGKNSIATSKSDREHHGYGISNIVRTAEKYEGEVDITVQDSIFRLEVQVHLVSDEPI